MSLFKTFNSQGTADLVFWSFIRSTQIFLSLKEMRQCPQQIKETENTNNMTTKKKKEKG